MKVNKFFFFYIFILLLSILSCSKGSKELEKKVETLEMKILFLEMNQNNYRTVTLDPSSKEYQRIDTTSGFFLISLKDVKPYLDGQKIILDIGNPTSATYHGFKMNVKWGRKFDSNKDNYDEWKKSLKEKDVSFTDELRPATWNRVELIVSPAPPEQLGYINLSMETDTISLYKR